MKRWIHAASKPGEVSILKTVEKILLDNGFQDADLTRSNRSHKARFTLCFNFDPKSNGLFGYSNLQRAYELGLVPKGVDKNGFDRSSSGVTNLFVHNIREYLQKIIPQYTILEQGYSGYSNESITVVFAATDEIETVWPMLGFRNLIRGDEECLGESCDMSFKEVWEKYLADAEAEVNSELNISFDPSVGQSGSITVVDESGESRNDGYDEWVIDADALNDQRKQDFYFANNKNEYKKRYMLTMKELLGI